MGNELPLDPSEVRARFSDRVDELDRLRTTAFHRQVVGALTAVLVDAPEGAALELGCGAGALLCVWRAAGRAAVGLDLTPKMCVRARAVSGCGVVTADACRLPFAGGSFAVVAGTFYLQIVPDPVAALREARRTLVSGGIHGVIVQSREWTEEAAETMGSRLGITQQERDAMLACARRGPGARRFGNEDLAELFVDAGFREPRVERCFHGYLLAATGRRD